MRITALSLSIQPSVPVTVQSALLPTPLTAGEYAVSDGPVSKVRINDDGSAQYQTESNGLWWAFGTQFARDGVWYSPQLDGSVFLVTRPSQLVVATGDSADWERVAGKFAAAKPDGIVKKELTAVMDDILADGVITANEADAFTRVAAAEAPSFSAAARACYDRLAKKHGFASLNAFAAYEKILAAAPKPLSREDVKKAVDALSSNKALTAAQLSVIGHTMGRYLGALTPAAEQLLTALGVVVST